jgi:hypothetical protein
MRASILFVVAVTGTAIADDAVDRKITADVEHASELWDQACPVAQIDGACVRLVSKPRVKGHPPDRCGPDPVAEIVAIPRDAAKVRAATAAFHDAIALFESNGGSARAAYARAKLAGIDLDYEAFLASRLPAHLDFRVVASRASFARWVDAKKAAATAMTTKLQRIADLRDPASTIAAAARAGQIPMGFANTLIASEIPAELGSDRDAVDSYCDQLLVIAEPLEDLASNRYARCLADSTALPWFDDSSRICEHELAKIRPKEFPPLTELHGDPTAKAPIEVEGPR